MPQTFNLEKKLEGLREAAKKVLKPPPPRLSGHGNFFLKLKKFFFPWWKVAHPFSPPFFGVQSTKRERGAVRVVNYGKKNFFLLFIFILFLAVIYYI